MLVEALVPEFAVQALDEGVLCGLSRLDEAEFDGVSLYQPHHDGFLPGGLHHFFESTSFMASTSSSFSARSFFSFVFSDSSSRSRLASLTSSPPYLLRQL